MVTCATHFASTIHFSTTARQCGLPLCPKLVYFSRSSGLSLPLDGTPRQLSANHSLRTISKRREMATATHAASKTVLVPVANGSEEIEAVTIIDTLRRAGAEVTVASVEQNLQVEMSRKVKLVADKLISELNGQDFDLIALPGGMPGAERLRDSEALSKLLQLQQSGGKFVTAICAAPAVVLESKGFLKGKKATAHPGFSDKLSEQSAVQQRVVVDGNIITSRGPGTSLEFALSLVHCLFGKEKANEVAKPMVISNGLQY